MECKVKITHVVLFVGLLLCSTLLAVESAPTIEQRHEIGPALHVLPLEEAATVVSLSSVESSDTPIASLHDRNTRAIIFRPLFVYRHQQIKKQRVQNYPVPQTVR